MNPRPTLSVLERLADDATPGPWHIVQDDTVTGGLDRVWANDGDELALVFGSGDLSSGPDDNAAFIAAFDPPTVCRLMEVVRAVEAVFENERGVCMECGWVGDHDRPGADSFARECLTVALRAAMARLAS